MASDDPSRSLVDALEAEAELVDRGQFTVDVIKGSAKLERYRVDDPAVWILLVVEAASLLGADSVRVHTDDEVVVVRVLGATLSEAELRSLPVTAGFSSGDESLTPEQRAREQARSLLGVAYQLLRARGLVNLSVDSDPGERGLRLRYNPEDDTATIRPHETGRDGVHIRAELKHEAEAERAQLLARARYSPLEVRLDERAISLGWAGAFGPRFSAEAREVPDPEPLELDGEALGLCGLHRERRTGARLLVLVNGVLVETLELDEEGGGFTAIIDGAGLRRDLSLARVLREPAFEAMLAVVEEARERWREREAEERWPEPVEGLDRAERAMRTERAQTSAKDGERRGDGFLARAALVAGLIIGGFVGGVFSTVDKQAWSLPSLAVGGLIGLIAYAWIRWV